MHYGVVSRPYNKPGGTSMFFNKKSMSTDDPDCVLIVGKSGGYNSNPLIIFGPVQLDLGKSVMDPLLTLC